MDKYRYQIKTRRRQPGEPLGQLYRDLWRLGVLAHPMDQHSVIFNKFMVDCFIDSIETAESDLGEKVRDRFPKTLREAYEISELLECKALYYTCYAETGIPRPGNTNSVCVVPSDCAEADRRLERLCLAVSRLEKKERLDVLWDAICQESTPLRRRRRRAVRRSRAVRMVRMMRASATVMTEMERDEWSRRKQRFARDRHRESFQPHDITVTPRSAVTPELTPHRREKSDGDLTEDLSTSQKVKGVLRNELAPLQRRVSRIRQSRDFQRCFPDNKDRPSALFSDNQLQATDGDSSTVRYSPSQRVTLAKSDYRFGGETTRRSERTVHAARICLLTATRDEKSLRRGTHSWVHSTGPRRPLFS